MIEETDTPGNYMSVEENQNYQFSMAELAPANSLNFQGESTNLEEPANLIDSDNAFKIVWAHESGDNCLGQDNSYNAPCDTMDRFYFVIGEFPCFSKVNLAYFLNNIATCKTKQGILINSLSNCH